MDQDKIEIISVQLSALSDIWNLVRSSNFEESKLQEIEELLLNIFEIKQKELQDSIGD